MRRVVTAVVAGAAAVALFGVLVHAVLVAAQVSEPAAVTVHGVTARRLWATAVVVLALVGVGSGALARVRLRGQAGLAAARRAALVALGAGLVALVNGALNLTLATGGPGTGNGVVGGAVAVVLGSAAVALGALALGRRRARSSPATAQAPHRAGEPPDAGAIRRARSR